MSRGSRLVTLGTDEANYRKHSSQRSEFYPGASLCLCLGLWAQAVGAEKNFRLAALTARINGQFGLAAVSSRTSCRVGM